MEKRIYQLLFLTLFVVWLQDGTEAARPRYTVAPLVTPNCTGWTHREMFVANLRNRQRLVTSIFLENPNPARIRLLEREDNEIRQDSLRVVKNWRRGLPSDGPRGRDTEQSNGRMRLDRQANPIQTRTHGVLMNWQVQINGVRGHSTVAQVAIPNARSLQGYDDERWKNLLVKALNLSFQTGGTVFVVQQTVVGNGNIICPVRGNPLQQ